MNAAPPSDTSARPTGAGPDRLAERMLAALLATAERRRATALVALAQPPLTVVALPDLEAGVGLLDRGEVDAGELKRRLDRLLAGHSGGVLHLVLVGGGEAERAALLAADREARDPNRLGVYHLDDAGRLRHLRGRRMGLLLEAGRAVAASAPLDGDQLAGAAERARLAQEEAAAFAAALERRTQTVTRVLGAVCLAGFALTVHWAGNSPDILTRMGANDGDLVRRGEVWRLLSHAFLHGGVAHLLVNLVALVSFGGFLEQLLGWRRYLILYAASALGGGVASAFLRDSTVSVGASGALWGLMAAGLALVGPRQRLLPGIVSARLRPRLMTVLLLNVGLSIAPLFVPSFPNIDLLAHFGGGLIGFLLVASGWLTHGLDGPLAAATPDDPPGWRVGAALTVAVLAASVALALATGKPWLAVGGFTESA